MDFVNLLNTDLELFEKIKISPYDCNSFYNRSLQNIFSTFSPGEIGLNLCKSIKCKFCRHLYHESRVQIYLENGVNKVDALIYSTCGFYSIDFTSIGCVSCGLILINIKYVSKNYLKELHLSFNCEYAQNIFYESEFNSEYEKTLIKFLGTDENPFEIENQLFTFKSLSQT